MIVSTAPEELKSIENKTKKRKMIKYKRRNSKLNVDNGKDVTEDNMNNNMNAILNGNDIHTLNSMVRLYLVSTKSISSVVTLGDFFQSTGN